MDVDNPCNTKALRAALMTLFLGRSMANRYRNRRHRSTSQRGGWRKRRQQEAENEAVAEAMANVPAALVRKCALGVRWLWRRALSARPTKIAPKPHPVQTSVSKNTGGAVRPSIALTTSAPINFSAAGGERRRPRARRRKYWHEGPFPPRPAMYRQRTLLSKGEMAFLLVLEHLVAGSYRVFAKVRLMDLVKMAPEAEGKGFWIHNAGNMHVDFVLCDQTQTLFLLAIELDDKSHRAEKRRKRDQFVNEVLACAQLPLLRVSCREAYDVEILRSQLATKLG